MKSDGGIGMRTTWPQQHVRSTLRILGALENYEACRATGQGETHQDDRTSPIGVMPDPPMPAIDGNDRNRRTLPVSLE